MALALNRFKGEYAALLDTCTELIEERQQIEAVITQSTPLESLDDLELTEQYLTGLRESHEVPACMLICVVG